MLTLRSGLYTESDLNYLINVIEKGECPCYGYSICDVCNSRRACEDMKRLKWHAQKLLNEHSFLEK